MTISLDERIDNKLMSLRLQIKEINKNLQDMAKVSLEVNHSNTFIERIQKMVDLKLESYTYSVDQKLINISLQTGNLEVPTESLEGKQILYKAGNEFVDPKLIQPSIDGTFWIKRENILEESQRGQSTNDNNPMNLDKKSRKYTKYTKAENSQKRELKKKCWYDSNCPEANCPFVHTQKTCGGFKDCKKSKCKRRHHPERSANMHQPKQVTNNSQRLRASPRSKESHSKYHKSYERLPSPKSRSQTIHSSLSMKKPHIIQRIAPADIH